MTTRMRLRRSDGRVYLDRWGWECQTFGVYVHHMSAPDPGIDLHDHPWTFASLILVGGYTEERTFARNASTFAEFAERWPSAKRGVSERRKAWSVRLMRLDECHRITELHGRHVWTLVLRGPRRRRWGFYLPDGWMDWQTYDRTVRAERRDMFTELVDSEGRVTR